MRLSFNVKTMTKHHANSQLCLQKKDKEIAGQTKLVSTFFPSGPGLANWS
jgi:hypothetical protein